MERQQYDRELKAQVVRLCEQGDVPIAQVARELGIDAQLLYRWWSRSSWHASPRT